MWQLHMSVSDELHAGDRRRHHPEPRRGRPAARLGGGDREPRALSDGRGRRRRSTLVQGARPRRGGRARPQRVPAPPAPEPGARGLAHRRHGARPHEAAAEPPVPGDRAPDGAHARTRCPTTSRSSSACDPKPGLKYSPDTLLLHHPGRVRGEGGRRLQDRPERRRPAQAPHQPHLQAHARRQGGGLGGDAQLREGEAAQRALAAEERRPAPAHDLQGGGVDRPPPARLPRLRHHPPAAARPARRGHRHRHARVHGLPRGGQQVHAHPARRLRAALLLPQRHHVQHGRGRSARSPSRTRSAR